jgi:hypothetical protein
MSQKAGEELCPPEGNRYDFNTANEPYAKATPFAFGAVRFESLPPRRLDSLDSILAREISWPS